MSSKAQVSDFMQKQTQVIDFNVNTLITVGWSQTLEPMAVCHWCFLMNRNPENIWVALVAALVIASCLRALPQGCIWAADPQNGGELVEPPSSGMSRASDREGSRPWDESRTMCFWFGFVSTASVVGKEFSHLF